MNIKDANLNVPYSSAGQSDQCTCAAFYIQMFFLELFIDISFIIIKCIKMHAHMPISTRSCRIRRQYVQVYLHHNTAVTCIHSGRASFDLQLASLRWNLIN